MSDHDLRRTRKPTRRSRVPAALLLIAAACGGERLPEEQPGAQAGVPEAGPPLELPTLSDAELMGVDRSQVVLALPWSDNVLAKDPAPSAARATLRSVEIARGEGFDRATFTFGTDAPFPGYRVVWNDQRTAMCGGEPGRLPGEETLLVSFEPATARDDAGRATAGERTRRPGLPAITAVEEICDRVSRLTWALAAADSTRVRVVELRGPARLLVDVMHPDAAAGAPGTPPAGGSATGR